MLRSRGRKSLATSCFAGTYLTRQGIYTLSPETAFLLRNKSTAKGVIYHGSFPGGTKQGLDTDARYLRLMLEDEDRLFRNFVSREQGWRVSYSAASEEWGELHCYTGAAGKAYRNAGTGFSDSSAWKWKVGEL